ncbi:hypothetical protein EIP91_003648 [Steccherinum ochraceum]|uniref:RlpA-like protein double-psi beta-barrel domain-containing protein n=1 Tax=Steccherinum ochraceum TaxID=92696 RepID=A0A4V2MW38_9APHY|nr:hypothetical protein EIP91_003648 [Steccherinum ochraceum]
MLSTTRIVISMALFAICSATPIASNNVSSIALGKRATVHTGQASFYEVGFGACGRVNFNTDFVVALPSTFFGTGYPDPRCFQVVTITNTENGEIAQAIVVDECTECTGAHEMDLSPGLFSALAPSVDGVGLIPISWVFDIEVL